MLGPLNVNLEEFGASSRHGFLPDLLPLRELSDPYYAEWEAVIQELPYLIKTKYIRKEVDKLRVLRTSRLSSEREWQRAYLVLSFLTHGYIWGGDLPSERLPPSISVPFLEVASHLGLPPIATYAGLNLWNFAPLCPQKSLSEIENLSVLHTFTGTEDEAWFYLISVSMEARGADIIPTMLKAMDAVRGDEPQIVANSLIYFADALKEIRELLERMYERCDPEIFYHKVRPFLAGSKNMTHAGLPKGVFYDEGDGRGEWRCNSGGSNAQSSLIQFFDIVLGVEHSPTGSSRGTGARHGFLEEMQNYMPGPHRRFLKYMESVANIREYVMTSASGSEVTDAYNLAVASLSKFRDTHIRIVARYIIMPSRKAPLSHDSGLNLAVASTKSRSEKGLHGTGGTELIPFLQQSRDETKETMIR